MKVIQKLVVDNNFEEQLKIDEIKVKILYDDTVFMFLSPDLHFFITHKALKLTQDNEMLLSLLISHELAHYLLDHQAMRMIHSFLLGYCYKRLFPNKDWRDHEEVVVHDPLKYEFDDKTYLQ